MFLDKLRMRRMRMDFLVKWIVVDISKWGALKPANQALVTDLVHAYNLCFAHKIPTPT